MVPTRAKRLILVMIMKQFSYPEFCKAWVYVQNFMPRNIKELSEDQVKKIIYTFEKNN